MHTLRFSLRIESNRIDGVAVSHTIVKHSLVDNYVVGCQLLEDVPFFVAFGFV